MATRVQAPRMSPHNEARHRHPHPRRRRRRAVRGAARARAPHPALGHHRGQGPARQVRLHAHGAGRLQRRAGAGRFGRAPFHGHDRGRQVAATTRISPGRWSRRDRAHPRTRERARLLLRPQSGRHACTRRRSPGRRSTARCTRATSPASRSSTGWPSRSGRATSSGWRSTRTRSHHDGRRDRRSPAC